MSCRWLLLKVLLTGENDGSKLDCNPAVVASGEGMTLDHSQGIFDGVKSPR